MTELIGILLCVQGIGALITKLLDSSRSWFVVRHILPDGLHIPAGIVLILLGLLLLWRSRDRKRA